MGLFFWKKTSAARWTDAMGLFKSWATIFVGKRSQESGQPVKGSEGIRVVYQSKAILNKKQPPEILQTDRTSVAHSPSDEISACDHGPHFENRIQLRRVLSIVACVTAGANTSRFRFKSTD